MTKKALKTSDKDWRAWLNLRLANEWLKLHDEADEALRNELARLEDTAKVSIDDAAVQAELGVLYSKLNQRQKSLAHIEAALALSPEDPSVLICASEVYETLGDRSRAVEFVDRALANGWTLAQLENDPGQQQLLHEPRLRFRQTNKISSPAH